MSDINDELVAMLDKVTETLSLVLLHYGEEMPKSQLTERRRLVLDAQNLLIKAQAEQQR